MAGHSQFKNIMFRKGKQDKERSKLFAKLSREITVAAKSGMPDPAHNPRLRTAILAAKAESMPKDNIQRSIDKAAASDAENYEDIRYEGFGPGGVSLIIEALTDNRNRTAQGVRHAFTRNGGSLGETGTVAWQFTRKGVIVVEKAVAPDEERLLELALEGGAEDLTDSESSWDIVTAPQDFKAVQGALESAGVPIFSAEISMLPQSTIPVEGSEATAVLRLIDALEDLDDVQNVYANFDIPEEVMASL